MKLSLTMIIKNESRCIERCLKAIIPYVDMVVLCDTGSTDGTLEICKAWEDRKFFHVFSIPWEKDFSKARNHALELAENLGATAHIVLDADEEFVEESDKKSKGNRSTEKKYVEKFVQKGEGNVPHLTKDELETSIATNSKIKNLLETANKEHGKSWVCAFRERNFFYNEEGEIEEAISESHRIFTKGLRFSGKVHEQVDFHGPRLRLPITFLHDGYLMKGKGNRNLELLEEELKQNPEDAYLHYQIAITLQKEKEKDRALYSFQKFLEYLPEEDLETPYGKEGIIQYLYLVMDLNREELYQEAMDLVYTLGQDGRKKVMEQSADYHFALGLFYMKYIAKEPESRLSLLPAIEKQFLHCLSIGEENRKEGTVGTASYKAHHNLSLYYEFIGDKEKAKKELEEARKQ